MNVELALAMGDKLLGIIDKHYATLPEFEQKEVLRIREAKEKYEKLLKVDPTDGRDNGDIDDAYDKLLLLLKTPTPTRG